MRKFLLYFSLLILVSLISFILFVNPQPIRFESVKISGAASISIPEYLSKTDSIDPAAALQYKNEKEQLFLLIYEKKDTINLQPEVLFKKFSDDLIARIGHCNLVKYFPKQIGSHQAVIGNIRGIVNETGVYYRIAVISSESAYYEVLFGVSENRFGTYDEDMNRILDSFSTAP